MGLEFSGGLSLEAVFNGRGCLGGNFSSKMDEAEPFSPDLVGELCSCSWKGEGKPGNESISISFK